MQGPQKEARAGDLEGDPLRDGFLHFPSRSVADDNVAWIAKFGTT